ncbi:MAG: ATP-binding protein, partial [Candidatus Rokuibacteriota bacterium]
MPSAGDFEKLGVFYLGRLYDREGKKPQDELLLYDSKDLVTHAVCVGMTGSGKTGLCLALIEEAALDGIPAILIDPKGDLANLLLTFPALEPADFRPWINEDDARRKDVSPDDYARQQAEQWRKGLAAWGEDGARIQRLRDAADFAVYTPGSNAGIPLSILKSFAAPPPAIREDDELLRERIGTTATSLLGLLGIDADPIRSREHILIATILDAAWRQGQELDLAGLIQQIQTPAVKRVGVLDLEAFFPSGNRFALAMSLNNLLAAPAFGAWMEGEPLDVDGLLHTRAGKPRIAILSIAHLNDAERMFFVSLLLNQVVGWMRAQSGTTSLRALVYMDEIFGFFPPVANPPSKTPLLTLLKQARAFGVGVVLATQNPVDLDYKGLSNTGTWFIGRLQTERDKARVLDGLEGAAGSAGKGLDRRELERTLSGLSSRVFLMNNVHEDAPVVFETRWVMSYLRGPLTRAQIKTLMDARRGAGATAAAPVAAAKGTRAPAARKKSYD